jgi:hypothetical protein
MARLKEQEGAGRCKHLSSAPAASSRAAVETASIVGVAGADECAEECRDKGPDASASANRAAARASSASKSCRYALTYATFRSRHTFTHMQRGLYIYVYFL